MIATQHNVKMSLYRVLQSFRVAPSIWMVKNPFKIHEYFKLVPRSSLKKHYVVLDLGCGRGFQTQILARYCQTAIGVDIDQKQIAAARHFLRYSYVKDKVKFICARLEEADLPPSSLDMVFSFSVLEHISNLAEVLTAITRLLKPGGELHVSVDSLNPVKDPEVLAKHKQDYSIVQYFTPESLRQQLEAAGLEVLEISPMFTSEYACRRFEADIHRERWQYGLARRVLLYKRLKDADMRSAHTEGVMLIAHARRPMTHNNGY